MTLGCLPNYPTDQPFNQTIQQFLFTQFFFVILVFASLSLFRLANRWWLAIPWSRDVVTVLLLLPLLLFRIHSFIFCFLISGREQNAFVALSVLYNSFMVQQHKNNTSRTPLNSLWIFGILWVTCSLVTLHLYESYYFEVMFYFTS